MEAKRIEKTRFDQLIGNAFFRMIVLLAAVVIFGAVLQPGVFLTGRNIQSVFKQLSEYGILAIAVFICMLSGGIDLSVVYIANFCAIVSGNILIAKIVESSFAGGWILAVILLSLVIGLVFGFLNGVLVAKLHVPPMLATLGTGQLFLGISTVITKGKSVTGIPKAYTKLAGNKVLGLPMVFIIFLLCAAVIGFVISRTSFGLRVRLIGTSAKAAVFSGVDYVKNVIIVYMISGLLASISGMISLMKSSSAKADYGVSYVLFSILICVFGGTDPNGGTGSVLAITIATIILQMISTLTNMFSNINSFYRDIAWGLLLLIVMVMNHSINSRHAK